ncbi:MAG: membrane integrity-associated transporter subunit PqiC [Psychrobium sp.]|nr:membrane integrity-associated transporter subunit PqiC [Psychrobium sp.]
MNKLCAIFAVVLLCVGCASSDQQISYYQLATGPSASKVFIDKPQLMIDPIDIVDYLKRPNILFKQQSNTLYVTKYHVWAEPLDLSIARGLVNRLNSSQDKFRVDDSRFSRCSAANDCYRLRLFVEKFYPTHDSTVEFAGKYQIFRGDKLLLKQDFSLMKVLREDGYPHAVFTLRELLNQLSTQIELYMSQQP